MSVSVAITADCATCFDLRRQVLRDEQGVDPAIEQDEHDATRLILGAQVYARPFYEKLGYRAFGAVFDSAGIDHRMKERLV